VKNDFFGIFVASDLDLWPLELKFALIVTLALSSAMFPLNWKFLRLSHFEKIGGTGETDRRTDGRGATLNAAHKEGLTELCLHVSVENWRA